VSRGKVIAVLAVVVVVITVGVVLAVGAFSSDDSKVKPCAQLGSVTKDLNDRRIDMSEAARRLQQISRDDPRKEVIDAARSLEAAAKSYLAYVNDASQRGFAEENLADAVNRLRERCG
jgi:hypothetical protein